MWKERQTITANGKLMAYLTYECYNIETSTNIQKLYDHASKRYWNLKVEAATVVLVLIRINSKL